MNAIFLVPYSFVCILASLSLILSFVLLYHLIAGIINLIQKCRNSNIKTRKRWIFNLYLFHHIFICFLRCLIIFIICLFLLIKQQCLVLDIYLYFLLFLSTFDLFLIIIGETAHFWDSTINYHSTLYSKYCLIFGLIFNYFLSILFLSIHLTISGENPFDLQLCQYKKKSSHENETSRIPIILLFGLFVLLNFCTLIWIYTSYKDIIKLKRKRLATIFFYSLLLTKFKENERSKMVAQSSKRLRSICLFVLSNSIVILPILILKMFHIQLNMFCRILFICLTILPWCESLTFLFYREMKIDFRKLNFQSKQPKQNQQQQRVGKRLSSYQENILKYQIHL